MLIQPFSERTRQLIEWGGGAGLSVLIALLFLAGVFELSELATYDWRFQVRGERKPLDDILIITMDEESEKALGQRLPWPRSVHANLLQTLMSHHPKLIVYDTVFHLPTNQIDDEALANTLYEMYNEERSQGMVVLAEYVAQTWESPLPIFADNAGGVGVINITKDHDDVVRSVLPMVSEILDAETTKPHFSLGLMAAILSRGGISDINFPHKDTILLARGQVDQEEAVLRVVAPQGRLYINYIGGSYSYPMLSTAKILQGDFQSEAIKDKVIFIGDTTLTAHDYFLTPFRTPNPKFRAYFQQLVPEGTLPNVVSLFGVEIHAQVFQTIMEGAYIRKMSAWASVIWILVVGSLSGWLLFHDRGFGHNTALLFLALAIVWGLGQYLFTAWEFWLELTPLITAIIVNYVAGLGVHRAVALYNRNQVKNIFQHYVSPAVVEEILRHPEKVQLGGERQFLTVLFSDIRGFTPLSERMDPHELARFINEYLTAMTNIILKYRGTLDKYVGDEIMAFYGAPVALADHAARAGDTALEMMEVLCTLQQHWRTQGKPVIRIGIGINSGMMSVGNMGSDTRFDFTVMGDQVNLGARLEGTNKMYGTNIILSEHTYQEISQNVQPNRFITRELDLIRVKGKKEPVKIYELMGRTGQVNSETLQRIEAFTDGLAAYRNREWEVAIEHFKHALSLELDDIPSQLYIQRCHAYQTDPPSEGWDGVYTMTTK